MAELVELSSGATTAKFPSTSVFPLVQLGFLDPSTVFFLYKAQYLKTATLVLVDLAGSVTSSINLASSPSSWISNCFLLLSVTAASPPAPPVHERLASPLDSNLPEDFPKLSKSSLALVSPEERQVTIAPWQ